MRRTVGDESPPEEGNGSIPSTVADYEESLSSNGESGRETTSAPRNQLPAGGRLVWIPPGGSPLEVSPSELRPREGPTDESTTRSCERCGEMGSVETVVREHVECGHVRMDGFVQAGGETPIACPKCGSEDETEEGFVVVGSVYSCIHCGQTLDRPLGAGDEAV